MASESDAVRHARHAATACAESPRSAPVFFALLPCVHTRSAPALCSATVPARARPRFPPARPALALPAPPAPAPAPIPLTC